MKKDLVLADFDENCNLIDNDDTTIVICYTNECTRCKVLTDHLNHFEFEFSQYNLDTSGHKQFYTTFCAKLGKNNISVPLIILYKNGEFIKKLPNSFTINNILKELENLN